MDANAQKALDMALQFGADENYARGFIMRLLLACNREDITKRAVYSVAEMAALYSSLEKAKDKAIQKGAAKLETGVANDTVDSVTLLSTSIKYGASTEDKQALQDYIMAYNARAKDFAERYKHLIFSLRKLPNDWKEKYSREN